MVSTLIDIAAIAALILLFAVAKGITSELRENRVLRANNAQLQAENAQLATDARNMKAANEQWRLMYERDTGRRVQNVTSYGHPGHITGALDS